MEERKYTFYDRYQKVKYANITVEELEVLNISYNKEHYMFDQQHQRNNTVLFCGLESENGCATDFIADSGRDIASDITTEIFFKELFSDLTEKEKKRLEMYEQRYAESWKKREINEEGTLKPFSKEELEHIFMLNDHLKELTSSTIDKTLRVSRHLLDEIEKGYKDFEDYQIESYIGMTYLDDGDETLEEQE